MTAAVSQLGYLGFAVSDLGAWERFTVEVLGLGLVERHGDGALALRMDGHRQRILVEPGGADDLAYVGWQVDDDPALMAIVERLRAAGVEVVDGTVAEAARRRVHRLVKLHDPDGLPVELFWGPERVAEPFRSSVVRTGFVADERG